MGHNLWPGALDEFTVSTIGGRIGGRDADPHRAFG